MAIWTGWDNAEHSLIRQVFTADWSGDDLLLAEQELLHLMTTVSQRVDLILDFERSRNGVPDDLGQLLHILERRRPYAHDRHGVTILVQPPAFIRGLVLLGQRRNFFNYADICLCQSLGEAYGLLAPAFASNEGATPCR
jgi:hypothetical protein